MDKLLEKYLANGLADFEGLRITGTVPIKQEVVNGLIAELLQSEQAAPTSATPASPASADDPFTSPAMPPPPAAPALSVDLRRMVMGMVKKAEIKADEGVITLEFEIRR